MERSFECPVCLEQYSSTSKPLLIPCGHTACSNCLSHLIKSKKLECPVCRSYHPNLQISSLSTNFALIHSESSKFPQSVFDRLEDLHKEISQLQLIKGSLQENYENSSQSLNRCRIEVNQKQELILTLINTISKNLLIQIDSVDAQLKTKSEKIFVQLENLISQRSELIGSLESLYSNKEELPLQIKLQIASLSLPKFELDMDKHSIISSQFDLNEKLTAWFGFLEVTKTVKPEIVPQQIEPVRGELRGFESARGRGRGRGEAREEVNKQPRQHKIEGNCWVVQNHYGKWEKLPPWFDAQLKAAKERNEESTTIFNNNKAEYFVKFNELKSYQIGLRGNHIRGKKIAFMD